MTIIRRLFFAVLVLGASCGAAAAMSQSQLPSYFPIPWSNVATCGTPYTTNCYSALVPQSSQIGVVNCAASLTDGFPPLTTVQASAGGCGPFIQDMNGILKQLSQWAQWQGAGATVAYNSGFSASIGGYPKGARLQNASLPTCSWTSTVDNNLSNPDTGGANWLADCSGGGAVGTSSGTNAQVVTVNPFVLQTGATISFKAGGSNTAELFVNANSTGSIAVFRYSQFGASASVGGEVVSGQMVTLQYDGVEWQCQSCAFATVGEEKSFTGGTVPLGWQIEDGSCLSTTAAADLYSYYGNTDLWATQAGGSCPAGQFHVAKANGRSSVAANNQGSGTGPLTNCTAGVTNNCGAQFQFLTAGQIPAISAPYTPAGSVSGTNGGSQSISVASLESGSAQNYAFGAVEINEIGLTIFGSSFSWSGTFSGTPATITVGSGSPSAVSIVNPNYQVLKAVKL